MKLKVYAPLGEAAGKTFDEAVPQPVSLRSLLRTFAARWQVEDVLFDANGELKPSFTVLVNGTSVYHRGGLDVPVTDADEVAILSFVTGG